MGLHAPLRSLPIPGTSPADSHHGVHCWGERRLGFACPGSRHPPSDPLANHVVSFPDSRRTLHLDPGHPGPNGWQSRQTRPQAGAGWIYRVAESLGSHRIPGSFASYTQRRCGFSVLPSGNPSISLTSVLTRKRSLMSERKERYGPGIRPAPSRSASRRSQEVLKSKRIVAGERPHH